MLPRSHGHRTTTLTELDSPLHVVVFVGTDHHPFNRLVESVDSWFDDARKCNGMITCLIQHGTSTPPGAADGVSFLDRAGVQNQLEIADIVVSHGGPSTIVEVLRSGKIPLVMPRDPGLGEHVDGHQQRFAAHMAMRGLIRPIMSRNDLVTVFESAMENRGFELFAATDLPDPTESAMKLAGLVDGLIRTRDSKRRRLYGR